jgi:hypothetical protein
MVVSVCDAIGPDASVDHTPTRVFWKRGCKRLKTKDERWKKRAKRRQMLERNGFATEAPSAVRKSGRLLGYATPGVLVKECGFA